MSKTPAPKIDTALLHLQESSRADIELLQMWFTSKQNIVLWGGPRISYPASKEVFYDDLTKGDFVSFSLMLDEHLVGFGQYQIHPPFIHLGRLAINPHYRRQGLGRVLLDRLLQSGSTQTGICRASLFVYEQNQRAYNIYLQYGFLKTSLPSGARDVEGCDFLTMLIK